ncbi:MAG: carbohydrate binding domain-containing protein [Armatimonadota bacterium]|nr:carbohydrate binding domain-containing protein [Armatimonadota bacterium]MCX7778514.1 carbohydrate binding domain-containing protein [Armatimonadota bacterium]MDW8024526.1 carbohydrate binding domain-containing protein [Armatimonadota bacterium]
MCVLKALGTLSPALICFTLVTVANGQGERLFPFVLPWDDSSLSVTNLSHWLHKPAGKFGHVRVGKDGHLYVGNERIRFFGVNLCFGACFPRKEDAEKIAARMAKFGINVVRFHHMDMQQFPNGIRLRGVPHTREFDLEALDRLDYLVAQLKRNGIYVNFNLLVSRPFVAADGLPPEIEKLDWKQRHVVGFFYQPMIELQKEYARKLLTHRNPYTGMTYAEDPAIAFVEINNENGLVHAWLGGTVDRLPQVFIDELQRQWNEWLRKRYKSTLELKKAWGVKEEPIGNEMLVNADFSEGTKGWILERHAGAEATAEVVTDDVPPFAGAPKRALKITVTKLGTETWHVQFNQPKLKVEADRPYTLTFFAKSDKPRQISVGIRQAHEPWADLGFRTTVNLTTQWQQFRFIFMLTDSDDNARLDISQLGQELGTYWIAGVSLRHGGVVGIVDGESLEKGTVQIFYRTRLAERTREAQLDFIRFLWETEDRYWQTLYHYIKGELKVEALVIGTIVGCSTPNMMAKLDCVDTHAYWQHPIFPKRPWDAEEWIVPNRTMVNALGGTLPGLAMRRVFSKPHCVTEYNHPAPNTYSSEGFLLLAAYAALQDWDAIYAFSYSHRRDNWDIGRIPNFFDIDQHPTKMVTLIPAVAMFMRGDVSPAKQQIIVQLDVEREIQELRRAWAWSLVHAGNLGVTSEMTLIHRVAIATEGMKLPKDALTPERVKPTITQAKKFISDTGELIWDLSEPNRGIVTVNTSRSKAVIGFGGGKRIVLGSVTIEPSQTMQDGWSVITLTAIDGDFETLRKGKVPLRAIITATGYAENKNMGWKEVAGYPPKSSVGRRWGEPPSLVEGVGARITIPVNASRVEVWALDERGQRKAKLPVQADSSGNTIITIDAQWQTLWYEVVVK